MEQIKIGNFIAKVRKEKGLTQQELADMIGVTDRAISNWENGRRMMDVSFFKPICDVLDISLSELIAGERQSKEKFVSNLDSTLYKEYTHKRRLGVIIKILGGLLCLVFLLLIINYLSKHPKIDIYHLSVFLSDPEGEVSLQKKFDFGENYTKHNVYFYGVEFVQLCDTENNCYELHSALKHNQISLSLLKQYMLMESAHQNLKGETLTDGGTVIATEENYSIIFCNTTEGNQDIYIGTNDMPDKLNGNYCGHDESTVKTFTRTYQIMSASMSNNDDYIDALLKDNNDNQTLVSIPMIYDLVVGNYYEFSFLAFDEFEDNIKNIFEYCIISSVHETDDIKIFHLNEPIYINKGVHNGAELNEAKNVSVKIKEGTLTPTSASIIITDLNGDKYTYGSEYWIERKENGSWTKVEPILDNYGFTAVAYHPDRFGILEFDLNWEWLYGALSSGYYRIVKSVFLTHDYRESRLFSVEFTLE